MHSQNWYQKTLQKIHEIPQWMNPNFPKIKELLNLPQEQIEKIPDNVIEETVFGVDNLNQTIEIELGDIRWDESRQGTHEEVLQEVEESFEENGGRNPYPMDMPLIVDVEQDWELTLNDGHHRYLIASESLDGGYAYSMPANVQIKKGRAKQFLEVLRNHQHLIENEN